jgi:hypothetical protein
LKLKALIAGQKYGEPSGLGSVEQHAILQTRPRLLLDGASLVTDEIRRELPG